MTRPADPAVLSDTHPHLAAELVGADATSVRTKSKSRVAWRCAHGHEWTAAPYDRALKRSGCPYCSGRRPITGQTDLATLRPDLAAEADGWDPATVKLGHNGKRSWRCARGHQWLATPNDRTSSATGCPFCSGRRVLAGWNDLATTHPAIAAEADGWDATTISAGSEIVCAWRCASGHQWTAPVGWRSGQGQGCPYCSGKRRLVGTNDLAATHPRLASQADGWSPEEVAPSSHERLPWRCDQGHTWLTTPAERTRRESGCPFCSGRLLWPGLNDVATVRPDLALQAAGWDPVDVRIKSKQSLRWRCDLGHEWMATPYTRSRGHGCPFCAGKFVVIGVSDLATTDPLIAAEAVGWNPTTVSTGSGRKMRWRCDKGHLWSATVASRTDGRGCPECQPHGFDPGKPAWIYLFERQGEEQFGITGNLARRRRQHAAEGWHLLDVVGPFPGDVAYRLEQSLVAWLRASFGPLPRTREAWSTSQLHVRTLRQLGEHAGVPLEPQGGPNQA